MILFVHKHDLFFKHDIAKAQSAIDISRTLC